MNAISLVMEYNQCDFVEACEWLCQTYSIYYSNEISKHRNLRRRPQPRYHYEQTGQEDSVKETTLHILTWIVEHAGLSQGAKDFLFGVRHLKPDVVRELRIGSISNQENLTQMLLENFLTKELIEAQLIKQVGTQNRLRIFTPCILFPYLDQQGNVVALQSRYLGDKKDAPRFQFIGSKAVPIFNLPILTRLKETDHLYVSEGVTDCMSLLSSGYNAVAIPSASTLPTESLRMIAKYRLHMFPDNDAPGREAFLTLRSKLVRMCSFLKRETLPEEFKDYSEYYQHNYEYNGRTEG